MTNKEIISEMIEKVSNLENIDENIIYNVHNFKYQLERVGLMTDELDNFIENYMKFDNK